MEISGPTEIESQVPEKLSKSSILALNLTLSAIAAFDVKGGLDPRPFAVA